MLSAAFARHLAGLGLCRYEGIGPVAPVAYLENMPSTPDRLICIYNRPGPAPDRVDPWEYPQVQVLARDAPGPSRPTQDLLTAIAQAVHGTTNLSWAAGTVDEVWVTSCDKATSGLVNLGPDQSGRPVWSITFQTELNTAI